MKKKHHKKKFKLLQKHVSIVIQKMFKMSKKTPQKKRLKQYNKHVSIIV